jgi:uncharacterized protein (TIGR03089 family)
MNLADALLAPILSKDPAAPLITYYDDATGERIELSGATLANWAAKTANLLRDEFGALPGARVAVLLPAHWQAAAVLLGAWWAGAEVVLGNPNGRDGADGPELAFTTADRVAEADDLGADEIAVLSLDPFGRPADDLAPGLTDYASHVRVHGDQFQPSGDSGVFALSGRTADEVLAAARDAGAAQGWTAGDRVLSTLGWSTPQELIANFVAVLAVGASLVQVANPDSAALERRAAMEKATARLG